MTRPTQVHVPLSPRGTLRFPDGPPPRPSRWRRALLITLISLPIVLAGAGVGGWYWLSWKVDRAIHERLERLGARLRRTVTAESVAVDLRASTVRVSGLVLAPADSGRITVRVDEVTLSFDRWAAIRGARSAAVTRVALGAVEVSVPAGAREATLVALQRAVEREVAAFAEPAGDSGGGGSGRALPELAVGSIALMVDRGGERETLVSGGMDLDLSKAGRTRVALRGRPAGGPEVAVTIDAGKTLADWALTVEPDAPLALPAPFPASVRRLTASGRTIVAEGVHVELPDGVVDVKTAKATVAGEGRPELPVSVELAGVVAKLSGKRAGGDVTAETLSATLASSGALTSRAQALTYDVVVPGLGAAKGSAKDAVAEVATGRERVELTLRGASVSARRGGVEAEGTARTVHVTARLAGDVRVESADADVVAGTLRLPVTFEALKSDARSTGQGGAASASLDLRHAKLALTEAALSVIDSAGVTVSVSDFAAHVTQGERVPHVRASGRLVLPDGSPHRIAVEADLDPHADPLAASVLMTDVPVGRWLSPRYPDWRIPDAMRADVDLRVVVDRARRIGTATGRVAVRDAGVYHRRLADESVDGVSFVADDLTLAVSLDEPAPALWLDVPRLRVGAAELQVDLLVPRWSKRPAIVLALVFARQKCQSFAAAIPRAVLGPLAGMKLGGKMAFSARLGLDFARPDASYLALSGDVDDCWPETLGAEADEKLQAIREGSFVRVWPDDVRVGPGTGGFVAIGDMPPYVPGAALMTEDGLFYSHHGFRLASINRSIRRTVALRRFRVGGSTITQQLAKNIFLDRRKTLARKIREAILAWNLERTFAKDTLLELYLNIIEYGPGIFGISKAAQFYFGKSVSDLTPLEAAFLMGLKPQPKWGYSVWRKNTTPPNWKRNLRNILEKMARRGFIPPESVDELAPYDLTFRRP